MALLTLTLFASAGPLTSTLPSILQQLRYRLIHYESCTLNRATDPTQYRRWCSYHIPSHFPSCFAFFSLQLQRHLSTWMAKEVSFYAQFQYFFHACLPASCKPLHFRGLTSCSKQRNIPVHCLLTWSATLTCHQVSPA